jgi:hypothetical protein
VRQHTHPNADISTNTDLGRRAVQSSKRHEEGTGKNPEIKTSWRYLFNSEVGLDGWLLGD